MMIKKYGSEMIRNAEERKENEEFLAFNVMTPEFKTSPPAIKHPFCLAYAQRLCHLTRKFTGKTKGERIKGVIIG
jgi:hypothetical protein